MSVSSACIGLLGSQGYGKMRVDVGERSFGMRIQGLGFRVSGSVIWAYSGFGNRAFPSGVFIS